MDLFAMLKICLQAVGSAVLMPGVNTGFLIFLVIIYMQYKNVTKMQQIVYSRPRNSLSNLVLTSVLSGMVAGIVVSLPMTFLGISFSSEIGAEYLIFISLILMLFQPRFLCFSYSGGILSLVSLIFGIKSIDVTGIMILVGLLHLLESILIFIDGYRGAVPVFLRNEDGSVTSGFTMRRFWPIPIALIVFMGFQKATGDVIATPDWWPLIKPYMDDPSKIQDALFTVMPVAAVLGYSEFTSTYLPVEKCKATSYKLAVFSLSLLLLAVLSSYIYIFKYIAAVFAPLVHEWLIQYERRLEKRRKPIFSPADEGIRVLDTIPNGPGESIGILPGDTITAINNVKISDEKSMYEIFKQYLTFVWIDVKGRDGSTRTLEYKDYQNGVDDLGIISVPRVMKGMVVVSERPGYITRLIKKIFKRNER